MSTGKTIALTRRSFVDTPTTLFLPSLLNTIPLYKTLVTFFPALLLPPFYTFCFMHTALLSPLYASISLEFSTRLLCTEWIVSGFNSNDILMKSCSFTLQSNEVTLPCQSLFRMSFWIISFFFFPLFFFFFKFYFIFKHYSIVLVLPNIKMNPPQVYSCSPSWTLLPPPSPYPGLFLDSNFVTGMTTFDCRKPTKTMKD